MEIEETTDAARLAALHARAFPDAWDAAEMARTLAAPGTFALAAGREGMLLIRTGGGQADVLTFGVAPGARRRGLGAALFEAGKARAAALGAQALFLEVAEDNAAAIALYRRAGAVEISRRRGYYSREGGKRADALSMRCALTDSPTPLS